MLRLLRSLLLRLLHLLLRLLHCTLCFLSQVRGAGLLSLSCPAARLEGETPRRADAKSGGSKSKRGKSKKTDEV